MNARRILCALALAALLAACDGGGQPAGVPSVKEAKAERDVIDGAAKLSSTVTVTFDRSLELAPSKVPLASHFELSVPDVRSRAVKRVLVAQASVAEGNSRLVTLHVDTLVTDGSVLRIAERAFKGGAEGEITANVESDLSPEIAVLASTALEPTRPEPFQQSEPPPVVDTDRDAAAMRLALETHLNRRGVDATARRAVLARYDSISSETVPSPKLRAALAALTGTFAEPAIDYLLTGDNCTGRPAALIAFQTPSGASKLVARSTLTRDGRRLISISPATEGNRIEHLMPLLAHEAIHCDNLDGRFEEVAATAFDTFLYLQLLTIDHELADAATPLARDLNIDAIAMINSGRRLPESVGILRSAAVVRALPGTNSTAPSFFDLVVAAYPQLDQNDSPEEPLAKRYADSLAQVAGMKPGQPFNLRYLDELMGRATDPEVLAAAIEAFGLVPL